MSAGIISLLFAGAISLGVFAVVIAVSVKRPFNIVNLCFAGWSLAVAVLSLYFLITRNFTYSRAILSLCNSMLAMIAYYSLRIAGVHSNKIMAIAEALLLIPGIALLIISILSFSRLLK